MGLYTIRGHANQNVQLIDTSKQEILDILGVSKVEADALLALYQSTNMAPQNFETWNTLTPVDEWNGVTVENGVITELYLGFAGLTGSIPPELGSLTSLEHLSLNSNQLTGVLPLSIGQLENLTELWINNNLLTGVISDQDFMTFLNALTIFKFDDTELFIEGVSSD